MEIEAAARRINRAAETAAGAMMIVPALMAATYHHYRSVLDAIVEHNADRCEIVVGTRVDGPVLAPFDRRALAVAGVKGHRAS